MNYKTKILVVLATYMYMQERDRKTTPITQNMYRYKSEIDLLKSLLNDTKINWKQQVDHVINLFTVLNTIGTYRIKYELLRDYNFDIEAFAKMSLWLQGEE